MITFANKTDAPQIFRIETALIACPWTLRQIEHAIENPAYIFLVLKEQSKILGYASLRAIDGEAEINNIAVLSAVRGCGYGDLLLKSLLSRARERGVNEFFLEVATENSTAIALYQKHGFTCIATRKNYYGTGRDALVLKL